MFLAAFTSALQAKLQATQAKRAWLLRLSAATCPHAEPRWLLYAGPALLPRPRALACPRACPSPPGQGPYPAGDVPAGPKTKRECPCSGRLSERLYCQAL